MQVKEEGTYTHLWLIHVVVWQKSTQDCKAIILQLKLNSKKNIQANFCFTFWKTIYVNSSNMFHYTIFGHLQFILKKTVLAPKINYTKLYLLFSLGLFGNRAWEQNASIFLWVFNTGMADKVSYT